MEGLSFILRLRRDLRWIRRRPLNASPGFRVGDLAQPWFLRKRKDFMHSRSTVAALIIRSFPQTDSDFSEVRATCCRDNFCCGRYRASWISLPYFHCSIRLLLSSILSPPHIGALNGLTRS